MRRFRTILRTLGPLLLTVLLAADLWAGLGEGLQPTVVGGGGGRSLAAGGDLVLTGTAGQAAVGRAQGGAVSLEAGFWTSLANVVSAAGPSLPSAVDGFEPAYPNPFNPSTTVRFQLERAGRARLSVHDLRGRRVRVLVDGNLPAGRHERTWRGTDDRGGALASGVYMLRLETAGADHLQKVTLLK